MEAMLFDTLNILPRSFDVRFSHDTISLSFGVVFEQFAKEIIGKSSGGALRDLGFNELFFCCLDFSESYGFCWVFFSMRDLTVSLRDQPLVQNSLSCCLEISLIALLLRELVKGHQVLDMFFPIHTVTQNSLLGFSFWRLDLNGFPSSTQE